MDGDNPLPQELPKELQNLLNASTESGKWEPKTQANPNPSDPRYSTPEAINRRCIEYLARLPEAIQSSNGSADTMRAARAVCWGFDLGEERGFEILNQHYNPRCQPPWSEQELRRKCREAVDSTKAREPRGWLRDAKSTSQPHERVNNPSSGQPRGSLWSPSPSPSNSNAGQGKGIEGKPTTTATPEITIGIEEDDPHRLARLFLTRHCHVDGLTLRHWNGEFCVWREGAYDRVSESEIRKEVVKFIEAEFRKTHARKVELFRINSEKGSDEKPPRQHKVTRHLVSDALQALQSECGLNPDLSPPCWLDDGPPATEIVATRNGLIHLPSYVAEYPDAFIRSTPRFFSFNRVNFDFEHGDPEPRQWLRFLDQLWADDPQSVDCLQEWFGYLLTSDTSQQKMLLILGPPRAGKGTIARVLIELIGYKNVCSPTLGKLAGQFGLQDLIGKTLAMITDAQLSGRHDIAAIREELLSISGEDSRTVSRKHIESVTLKLSTRFVFLANQMPELGDASGAMLGRFIILRLVESFAGREDLELTDRLLLELPGILNWAIEGWARLNEKKRFTLPESVSELVAEAESIISPIRAFIEEKIVREEGATATIRELYFAWSEWCKKHGREKVETQEQFVAKLRAAIPALKGFRRQKGSIRSRGYEGIRVLSEFESGTVEF